MDDGKNPKQPLQTGMSQYSLQNVREKHTGIKMVSKCKYDSRSVKWEKHSSGPNNSMFHSGFTLWVLVSGSIHVYKALNLLSDH